VSNAIPVLHRSGLSGFSEFGVGGNEGDNSLPIILSSFTAKMVKGNVMLEWETSSEIENLGYIIRRHSIADGSPSIVIASFLTDDTLKGQESTTKATKYSYVDKIVEPGKTYLYTLYDVNYEGRENRLKEIEIEIKAEGAMFADSYTLSPAYPNPFNPRTVIPLKLAAGADVHFSLYDINGHMIRELYRGYLAAGSHNLPIDGATLATGIYFVRIRINNSIHVQKISLMK
ncbi:MAG: T9SS type A sorting domain-containing protein, partial [Candidatus Marinimicrobia bacterium]|nr:T9SS type A sorting domain-containing protein [Candidatus Neomarinimicrobiota bacterium]